MHGYRGCFSSLQPALRPPAGELKGADDFPETGYLLTGSFPHRQHTSEVLQLPKEL